MRTSTLFYLLVAGAALIVYVVAKWQIGELREKRDRIVAELAKWAERRA